MDAVLSINISVATTVTIAITIVYTKCAIVPSTLPLLLPFNCQGPIFMAAAHLMLVRDRGTGLLYFACIVIGLSDGILWSLGPLLTSKYVMTSQSMVQLE